MSWVVDKVFLNVDDFLVWLDQNFGDYIVKHINENHVHHTYAPNHSNYPKYSTLQLHKNMRSFHKNTNGWDDIAQNITIGKDGDIVTGRDIRKIPISAKGYNGTTELHPFAYEMIGNFDKGNDILQGKQLEAAVKISRYFYRKGKGVKFHRELLINGKQPKTCPGTGIDKNWFMELIKNFKFTSDIQVEKATSKPSIIYQVHVQGIGWQKEVKNGETAGTTGKELRLEAFTIRLKDTDDLITVEAHVEKKGWTPVRTNGEVVGTIGEGLRLEAIKIKCGKHSIYYRTHIQGLGWQEWKKNGEMSGTTGQSKRIEAIEIKLG